MTLFQDRRWFDNTNKYVIVIIVTGSLKAQKEGIMEKAQLLGLYLAAAIGLSLGAILVFGHVIIRWWGNNTKMMLLGVLESFGILGLGAGFYSAYAEATYIPLSFFAAILVLPFVLIVLWRGIGK